MPNETNAKSDFGAFLEQQAGSLRSEFEVGEKLTGTVTAVDRKTVFVDVNARSEGVLDRGELEDENGELTVEPGQQIEVYFMGGEDEDELRLTTRVTGDTADAALWDAYQGKIPVEGRVEKERTGGFEVKVGDASGFCPYSQIDIFRQDAAGYIGERFRFLIIEYDEHGKNLVLSRRQFLEREREAQKGALRERLEVGDLIEGKVTKLMPFGAFVDIGGTEGLIPMRELAWGRTESAEDVVRAGDKVSVKVLEIDWDQERFTLSLRSAQGDPWEEVPSKYVAGARRQGRVTKLMPFGAFVELEPGVEGLIHISKFGTGRRISHPKEVVEEGALVEVSIENIDMERRRISLSMEDTGGIESAIPVPDDDDVNIQAGQQLQGIVDGIQEFGIFVRLSKNKTGLLHISQLDVQGRDKAGMLRNMYPEGTEIDVIVQNINGDRISLTTPERYQAGQEQEDVSDYIDETPDEKLGSLGDALDGLNL